MKRVLSLLLVLITILSLTACGEKEKKVVKGLQVGFAMVDCTPESGTPMGGYGNSLEKLSTSASRSLYVSCLALTDGKDTMLLFSCDLGSIEEDYWVKVRPAVAKATGVKEKNIFFCATHTHSGPDLGVSEENAMAKKALDQWVKGAVSAAKAAKKDMAPATLSADMVQTEKLTFCRHYKKSDGSYVGDNFGSWTGLIESYAMEADQSLVVAKFDRKNKKDIMLMNFQLHPVFDGGMTETIISSDGIGVVRDYVNEQTGMEFIYFQGAAGNQNRASKILADATGDDIYTWAQKLGDYAINALPNLKPMNGDDIKIQNQVYAGKVWKETDPAILAKAKEVQEYYKQTDRDTANVLAREYGFGSVYHAGSLLGHQNYPDTIDMEINAVSIGEFGFITAPYEMFSREGIKIKTDSPLTVTAIMGYAGHYNGYIPSMEAYDYGCYESQTGTFERGTAELLADAYLEMLANLAK